MNYRQKISWLKSVARRICTDDELHYDPDIMDYIRDNDLVVVHYLNFNYLIVSSLAEYADSLVTCEVRK